MLACLAELDTLIIESNEKSMLAMGREGRQATRPNESSTQLNMKKLGKIRTHSTQLNHLEDNGSAQGRVRTPLSIR